MRIACVVEGRGEVEAVPILIRRIGALCQEPVFPQVEALIRVPSSKLRRADELRRAVDLAALRVGIGGSVLVMLDADDDCPAQLGPWLLAESGARGDVVMGAVVANREYEAWFLAAAESIAGSRGLAEDLATPEEPESIRGAKEWLSRRKVDGSVYSPSLDQPALTATFDLDSARRADSFDKCYREIRRLLGCP